jgi:glycosyltransferase 2 family protein
VALVAGAAALLYLGLASWSDPGQVMAVMRRFPPRSGALVVGLVLLGLALRAVRWHYYVRTLEIGVPAMPSVLAFVAGFAFTATPGKVGEVVKSFLLRRRFGARVSQTAGTLVVERVTDLLAVLILAAVGLDRGLGMGSGRIAGSSAGGDVGPAVAASDGWAWNGGSWVLGASALVLAAALVFLLSARLQAVFLAGLARVPGLRRPSRNLPALLDSSRRLLTPARLTAGLALATAAWSCEALALHAILQALGAGVPRAGAFFAFAAASLLGVLSMLPGGLGGFEATMVVLLGQLAVTSSTAVAATLLFRLGTLWLVSVLGLLVLGGWMVVYGRRRADPVAKRAAHDRARGSG